MRNLEHQVKMLEVAAEATLHTLGGPGSGNWGHGSVVAAGASKDAHAASAIANSRQGQTSNQKRADEHADAAVAHGKAAEAHVAASKSAKTPTTKDYHNQVAKGHRFMADAHAKASGIYATI